MVGADLEEAVVALAVAVVVAVALALSVAVAVSVAVVLVAVSLEVFEEPIGFVGFNGFDVNLDSKDDLPSSAGSSCVLQDMFNASCGVCD